MGHFNEMAKVKLIDKAPSQPNNNNNHVKLRAQLNYLKNNSHKLWSQGSHIFIDSDHEYGSYQNAEILGVAAPGASSCQDSNSTSALQNIRKKFQKSTKIHSYKSDSKRRSTRPRSSSMNGRSTAFLAQSLPDVSNLAGAESDTQSVHSHATYIMYSSNHYTRNSPHHHQAC